MYICICVYMYICMYLFLLIQHQNTNMFSPESDNPGVQNMYCSAACMIICVLHGTLVLGATCAYWERSSKDIWTLTDPHTRRLI